MKAPALALNASSAPALWELEIRVADVAHRQQGIPRENIHPSSRILEDLHIDSLDLVELILALEEDFDVTIPDDVGKQMFVRSPLTIAALAEIVHHQWGTGRTPRAGWFETRTRRTPDSSTPFTQREGIYRTTSAPLFEPMAPTATGFAQFRRQTDGMRCVSIPAAEVELGSAAGVGGVDEQPLHRALLDAFLMDAEPVSVTAFVRFLNSIGAPSPAIIRDWCGVVEGDRRRGHFQIRFSGRQWTPLPGTEHQPMVLVSWFGAAAYSLWANGSDWRTYRQDGSLPTEAQWEYAARGAIYRQFPWGDQPATPSRAHVGWHRVRQTYPGLLPLAEVQSHLGCSPFGLHHMAGNIWHWCRDWYAADYYRQPGAIGRNPCQLQPTGIRSERGGSWVGPAELARSSYRRGRPPTAVGRCLGFRCVSSLSSRPPGAEASA